jgi:uncharacterized protein (DUF4415 family)
MNMTNTSSTISAERMAEIKAFKDKPDPDLPPITADFFKEGHFRNPEAAQKAIAEMRRQKQAEQAQATPAPVSVNLDADVSEWVAQRGADYSAIINQILREVIRLNRITATA